MLRSIRSAGDTTRARPTLVAIIPNGQGLGTTCLEHEAYSAYYYFLLPAIFTLGWIECAGPWSGYGSIEGRPLPLSRKVTSSLGRGVTCNQDTTVQVLVPYNRNCTTTRQVNALASLSNAAGNPRPPRSLRTRRPGQLRAMLPGNIPSQAIDYTCASESWLAIWLGGPQLFHGMRDIEVLMLPS